MNSALEKYYRVLGLTTSATQKDIKKAYFKLAKQYHPDINDTEEAQKKFIEINKAYEVLSNPELVKKLLSNLVYNKKPKSTNNRTKSESIKNNTDRRRKTSSRHFTKLTAKEILKRDMTRVLDYFLVITGTFMLPLLLFCISTFNNREFSETLSIFLMATGVIILIGIAFLFIPSILIFTHYYRTKK